MISDGYDPDDVIATALEVLQCTPDEVAATLGIEVRTLWGYCNGAGGVPPIVLRRLASLLEKRAILLCGLSETLVRGAGGGGRGGRTVVS